MADARVANPLVEQFRRGAVPRDLRLMAAQGLLPLKPDDLLELWTDLLSDAYADVNAAAQASLASYPAQELAPVLKSRETPATVLSWAVAQRPERELRELALQNASLPDETIEAPRAHAVRGPRGAGRHQPDAAAAAHARCWSRSRATRRSTTTSAAACASCARRSASGAAEPASAAAPAPAAAAAAVPAAAAPPRPRSRSPSRSPRPKRGRS